MEEAMFWYAARCRKGQELSIRKRLQGLDVDNFIPSKIIKVKKGKKLCDKEVPLITNLVFLHSTKSFALTLANGGVNIFYIIDPVHRSLLEIPSKQMQDFMNVIQVAPESVVDFEPMFHVGEKVRIVKGELAGVEGRIMENPTRTYVIVTVGELLAAKVQVPKVHLERI